MKNKTVLNQLLGHIKNLKTQIETLEDTTRNVGIFDGYEDIEILVIELLSKEKQQIFDAYEQGEIDMSLEDLEGFEARKFARNSDKYTIFINSEDYYKQNYGE